MKVLVLRPGALGDLLLALPALRAVKQRYPEAELHVAGNRTFAPVLELSPDVAGWLDFGSSRFTPLFVEDGEPAEGLESFELAIVWMRDPVVPKRLPMQAIGGDPSPAGIHVARRLWALIAQPLRLGEPARPAAAPGERGTGAVPPSSTNAGRPQGEPDLRAQTLEAPPARERFAVLHPGSGGKGKLWPLERFAAVGRSLDAPVRILSGPADADLGERLLELLPTASLHRPRDVLALARELAGADLFVGNDSGPGHLAAALGVPTVSVFGPTDPALWSPCGPRTLALGGNGRWPEATEVIGATLKAIRP